MVDDESSKALSTRDLAALSFRRNLDLTMLSLSGGALALLIGVRVRFKPLATLPVIAIALALAAAVDGVLLWMRRSPPPAFIDRMSRDIDVKRQHGTPAALSRLFIALAAIVTFGIALMLVLGLPI